MSILLRHARCRRRARTTMYWRTSYTTSLLQQSIWPRLLRKSHCHKQDLPVLLPTNVGRRCTRTTPRRLVRGRWSRVGFLPFLALHDHGLCLQTYAFLLRRQRSPLRHDGGWIERSHHNGVATVACREARVIRPTHHLYRCGYGEFPVLPRTFGPICDTGPLLAYSSARSATATSKWHRPAVTMNYKTLMKKIGTGVLVLGQEVWHRLGHKGRATILTAISLLSAGQLFPDFKFLSKVLLSMAYWKFRLAKLKWHSLQPLRSRSLWILVSIAICFPKYRLWPFKFQEEIFKV